MTNLTPQQENALALIREGGSDNDVVDAGIVSSRKTISRWRSSNPAWREAEADALGSVAEVLGAEGIRAIQRLGELAAGADDRAAVSAATTLASLLERRDARKKVVGGTGVVAAYIMTTSEEREHVVRNGAVIDGFLDNLRAHGCPSCGHDILPPQTHADPPAVVEYRDIETGSIVPAPRSA